MTLRWWGVCSTILFIGFLLLSSFIGAGTNCPGLSTGHEWVADCDAAVEKLNKWRDDDEIESMD